MGKCCGSNPPRINAADPCTPADPPCGEAGSLTGQQALPAQLAWFDDQITHCLEYARQAHEQGRPIVGIMCEYTPREVIMAAGGVPVCLCGGSGATIPAAEEDLPSNLCPLIKSTYGYHKQGNNQFLEMAALIVAETTCDGKKKMYELMAESRPMHVLELPQQQDPDAARAYWRQEVAGLARELETRFKTRITTAGLRKAIAVMNRERKLRRELAGLMRRDRPPLTGRQLLNLKSSISGIPTDLDLYEQARDLLAQQEPRQDLADRVRVLMTGVPVPHGAERVVDLIEESGGLIVAMENCTGIKPIHEDIDTEAGEPLMAIADKYFHLPCSVMTPNQRRMELLKRLAADYRPDCVIELIWQACLTYDVESFQVKRMVEQDLGLPYLRLQTDYSPADSARIAVRIEALYETVQGRRN